MQKLDFKVNKPKELVKAIIDELPFLSRHEVLKIIENKDVKINNVRIKQICSVSPDDIITIFYQERENKDWFNIVYKDDNIIIVNKRAGIEVESEKERDLLHILSNEYPTIKAVHRLDRNTEGLTIFALNELAEKELLNSFKSRKGIKKEYVLLAHGRVDISKIKRTVYLKKLQNLSKVWISEVKTSGYDPIITQFDIIEYRGENTLLKAELITGKTHQIRSHISYYGYPILGDNKYGNDDEKTMCLTAYKLSFCFDKKSCLHYLNNKSFEIIPSWL